MKINDSDILSHLNFLVFLNLFVMNHSTVSEFFDYAHMMPLNLSDNSALNLELFVNMSHRKNLEHDAVINIKDFHGY